MILQSTNVEFVMMQLERVLFVIVELVIWTLDRLQEVRVEDVMVSLLSVVSRNVVRQKVRLGPERVVEEISFSISGDGVWEDMLECVRCVVLLYGRLR